MQSDLWPFLHSIRFCQRKRIDACATTETGAPFIHTAQIIHYKKHFLCVYANIIASKSIYVWIWMYVFCCRVVEYPSIYFEYSSPYPLREKKNETEKQNFCSSRSWRMLLKNLPSIHVVQFCVDMCVSKRHQIHSSVCHTSRDEIDCCRRNRMHAKTAERKRKRKSERVRQISIYHETKENAEFLQ